MNVVHRTKRILTDPLNSFRMLQIVIAAVCIAIPLVLRVLEKDTFYPATATVMSSSEIKRYLLPAEIDSLEKISKPGVREEMYLKECGTIHQLSQFEKICKDDLGFRTSLSDYAHSSNSYIFGMLYMMAALLYIYNGVVYLNRKDVLTIQKNGPLANIVTGFSLIGVILNPNTGPEFAHYLFSILFFLGNVYMMLFIGKEEETNAFRTVRRLMGVTTILIFVGCIKSIDWYPVLWAESFSLAIISSYLIMMAIHVEKTKKKAAVIA